MANFTKKEIIAAFFRLLEQKPLSKITVKSIVEECGINRNTFYYHYKDIYDLVDDIFYTETYKVTSKNPVHGHWQDGCIQSMHWLQDHSMVIQNVFNSIKLETIMSYLFKVAHDLLITFAQRVTEGSKPRAEEIEFIADFYSHAFVGIFLGWIKDGMQQKPEEFIELMGRMLNGSIYDVLRRSDQIADSVDAADKKSDK